MLCLCRGYGQRYRFGPIVPGFSIVGALNRINEEAPDLLLRYGGHSMAAGATLKVSDLKRFKDLLNKEAMTLFR